MQTVMKAAQYLLLLANSFAEYCEISALKLRRLFILFRIKELVMWWDKRITDDVMLRRVMPRTVASIITKTLNYILFGMRGCGKGFWSWSKHVPHPVYVWQWTQRSLIVGEKVNAARKRLQKVTLMVQLESQEIDKIITFCIGEPWMSGQNIIATQLQTRLSQSSSSLKCWCQRSRREDLVKHRDHKQNAKIGEEKQRIKW